MVLVSYIPYNYISILQTKFSDREGHEARRVGLEAMPLDQHIEGRHGERQACLKIRPAPMHHLLQVADERQHREHRLDEHQVAGIPLRGMEAGVAQDNHTPINLLNQPRKQTPPRHPLHQWELKPTGYFRGKSPLGTSYFSPYNPP